MHCNRRMKIFLSLTINDLRRGYLISRCRGESWGYTFPGFGPLHFLGPQDFSLSCPGLLFRTPGPRSSGDHNCSAPSFQNLSGEGVGGGGHLSKENFRKDADLISVKFRTSYRIMRALRQEICASLSR
jgi:hypothetical protein